MYAKRYISLNTWLVNVHNLTLSEVTARRVHKCNDIICTSRAETLSLLCSNYQPGTSLASSILYIKTIVCYFCHKLLKYRMSTTYVMSTKSPPYVSMEINKWASGYVYMTKESGFSCNRRFHHFPEDFWMGSNRWGWG